MASNFRVQNIGATKVTLTQDIVFDKASGDVTLQVPDQVSATLSVPDMGGVAGTVGVITSLGTDNQLMRMDGSQLQQASSVSLSDAGALAGVLSVAGSAGNDLTLTAPTGQDLVLTSDSTVSVTGKLLVGDDLVVTGDLQVNGTTTSVNSTVVTIADNNLLLSSNYTTNSAKTGGLTVNYLPTATTSLIASPSFSSTSTVDVASISGFATGDIVLVSGADVSSNNGLYVLASASGTTLTINTSPTQDFLQNVFTTSSTAAGSVTKVNVAVLQAGVDGKFEVGLGSTAPLTFTDLALVSDIPAGGWVETTFQTTDGVTQTAATLPSMTTDKSVIVQCVYSARDAASTASNCGNIDQTFYNSGGTLTAFGSGVWTFGAQPDTNPWTIAVDSTGSTPRLRVTGAAATTVDWKLLYRYLISP